ncbi:hypothetical protein WJX72_011868 [[Myrmecia] bisecta]|uniref:ATP-dependent Clp protease proteolytic subunit n=1 Tax=[Myrmecia] bisecta TaxID=41462 RepID=A0AAW1P2R1_9CHLO
MAAQQLGRSVLIPLLDSRQQALNQRQTAQHRCSCSNRHLQALPQSRSFVQTSKHVDRLGPVYARRPRDPIVAPFIPLGQDGKEGTDMFGYLLRNRIIFVGNRIGDEMSTQIVASLLALEALDDKEDIKLYINSGGGTPYAVISILDTIEAIKPDVSTIAFGQAASTATLLLAAGAKGKRFAMPNTRIMMHQPVGGAMGSADEVNITTSELNRTMKVIHRFYSKFTGMDIETVEMETDRDNYMNPEKAKEMGLIDGVI